MRVLAGDIGGTNTRLTVYDFAADGRLLAERSARYSSPDHAGLEAVLEHYLADHGDPGAAAAGFAVAGPVVDGVCRTTNLPWHIDERALASALKLPVAVVNDFHGVALGVTALAGDDREFLQSADPDPDGPIAVLGAGTGLGEAILVPTASGPRVIASEGGHADLAPRSDLEIDLLRFLLARHPRVSYERALSGRGLVALYDFVVDRGLAPARPSTRAAMAAGDPAAVVTRLADDDPACGRAVDLFVGLYGAEAGNLALKVLPTGGVYVAGGIAQHILPRLRSGFLPAFLAKGRMSALLARMPVAVVRRPDVGTVGAALAARARLA
jgi:glucokinase